MQKFFAKENINLVIVPITLDQAESLENYLTEAVVLPRNEGEFVAVVYDYHHCGLSLVSYGRYDKTSINDEEKNLILALLEGYGREWMKSNSFEICEAVH